MNRRFLIWPRNVVISVGVVIKSQDLRNSMNNKAGFVSPPFKKFPKNVNKGKINHGHLIWPWNVVVSVGVVIKPRYEHVTEYQRRFRESAVWKVPRKNCKQCTLNGSLYNTITSPKNAACTAQAAWNYDFYFSLIRACSMYKTKLGP